MIAWLLFFFALFLVAAITVYLAVKIVPEGSCFTLERFGRFTRILEPGLHIITPFADLIGRKINMRESLLTVPALEFTTADNIVVRAEAVVFFRVVDAQKAAYEVEDLPDALANVALATLRAEISALPLEDVLTQRDEMCRRMRAVIEFATGPWGATVTRVDIKSLNAPSEITHAMAKLIKAEREKRAEVLSAEGEKEAALLRADSEKQATLRAAEARRRAATLDAEARERVARAEVQAARYVSDAVRRGEVEIAALEYLVGLQHAAALDKVASGGGEARPVVAISTEPPKLSMASSSNGVAPIERPHRKEPERLSALE